MMWQDSFESIKKTKESFEASFEASSYYDRQTQDKEHLEQILNFAEINNGMKILDLGTGTGYLAFSIAGRQPDAEVVGLDIVEKALVENRKRAAAEGLDHLHFINYNGVTFPFADQEFGLVITRYALHHFPAINETFQEIRRVLKPDGRLFLIDPAPNDNDKERFVDAYMQMKKDGHIRFYTKEEWRLIGQSAGLHLMDGFETKIRFPKKWKTWKELDNVMNRFDQEVIKGYAVEIIDDEIWITEKVNNLMFQTMESLELANEDGR